MTYCSVCKGPRYEKGQVPVQLVPIPYPGSKLDMPVEVCPICDGDALALARRPRNDSAK